MNDFYKKLKSLREEKGIDLEKIHKRTKISLSALHAIEKGQFDQLPYTYVRLFLRAYAVEIGVNPEETLEDLEVYLGNKTIPKNQENNEPVSIKDDVNTNNKILNKEDKKNYLTSIILFFIGAFFWGIHLTSVDGIFGPKLEETTTDSLFYHISRAMVIILWAAAAFYQNKFIKTRRL